MRILIVVGFVLVLDMKPSESGHENEGE